MSRFNKITIAAALVFVSAGFPGFLSAAQAHMLSRISVDSAGAQSNGDSWYPAMSADGRYVAFASSATNLTPNDVNGKTDIFWHDKLTGVTLRASVNASGDGADADCHMPAISGDGQFVAFHTEAGNLAPNDANGCHDIYVFDVQSGQITRVSVSSSGIEGNGESKVPTLSFDGRYVVFHTAASNLYPGDANGCSDIALHDRVTGETDRITLAYGGAEANGNSFRASISANGRYMAYQSVADNLVAADLNGAKDIFVYDRVAGVTVLASVDSSDVQGDGDSSQAWISADGRFVAFQSAAGNLVSGDVNSHIDVFVRDLDDLVTYRASVDSYGVAGTRDSLDPVISPDGDYVSFHSESSNLVADDTNGRGDVFRHDLDTGETIRVSLSSAAAEGDDHSGFDRSPIAYGGVPIAFAADAGNLVPEDANNRMDIFVFSDDCDVSEITSQPEGLSLCENDDAVFTVEATSPSEMTYQWRKDGLALPGASNAVLIIEDVLAEDAGAYDVLVTNDCGAVTSESALLTVGTIIVEGPTNATACDGHNATFSVTASAPDPVTYQWRVDGVEIPGAAEAVFILAPVGYADAGDYDVVVSSPCGSVASDSASLGVVDPVTITGNPEDQTACPMGELTLSVQATGGGAISYQWRRDGQALASQTDAVLHYSYVTEALAGEYDVIASNECSTVISTAATVIVPSGVVMITEHPRDQEICEGQTATFTVEAESLAPLNYQWRKNGDEILGATESSYVIESVAWEDYGEYSVIVWDACDSTASQSAGLAVRFEPSITQHPQSLETCQGASATFSTATSAGIPETFQWRKDGVDIDGADQSVYSITEVAPEDAGFYDVAVTNACGTAVSDQAELTVSVEKTPSIVVQPASLTACVDGAAEFSVLAKGTNLDYQWQKYQLYQFVDIPDADESSYAIDPVTPSDAGAYRVIVGNACGSITSLNANLRVDDGVIVVVLQPAGQTGCEGGAATFEVGVQAAPPLSYQWRKGGEDIPTATEASLTIEPLTLADTGVYDVVITSTCGSAVSDSALLDVLVYQPPLIVTPPAAQVICEGDQLVLSVAATGADPLGYQWRKDGVEIPGQTADVFIVAAAQADDDGVYDVLVSNPCDVVASPGAEVTVTLAPVITRQPMDREIGAEEDVTFIVEAEGEALNYQWRKNSVDIPGAEESTYTIIEPESQDEALYEVEVSNCCGAVVSTAAALTLLDYPHTRLVSINSAGEQSYDDSSLPSLSGDGRYVAFISSTNNLAPGVFSDRKQVYLHDRQELNTIRVTENPDDWQTNGDCFVSDMSVNERWIVFDSDAGNIVPGDTNGKRDVFLFDRQEEITIRISVDSDGRQADGDSSDPSISSDGNYIAYQSDADNLVPGDANGASDAFVYCRQTGEVVRISVDSAGGEGDGASHSVALADNGARAVFCSDADNLVANDTNGATDVFVHYLATGATRRISVSTNGDQADGDSARPCINTGGSWAAYQSTASNLAADDDNDSEDVFVHDLASGETILISRSTEGTPGDDDSTFPSISEDGMRIAFLSRAENLTADDTNGCRDVFLHDREFGVTTRISVTSSGQQADGDSDRPAITSTGGAILFQSDAANLVNNDLNGCTDVFKHTPGDGNTRIISLGDDDQRGDGPSVRPACPGVAGHYVLFSSLAGNLDQADKNRAFDIFCRDVQTGRTFLCTTGWTGDDHSTNVEISSDGGSIVFESLADNLTPSDANNRRDVFVYDVDSRTLELVSMNSNGEQADDNSYDPVVSADGRYVAFSSIADNLLPAGPSDTINVFVRDRVNQTTEWVSVGLGGAQPNAVADAPSISGDGRYVAYRSAANNIVPDDANNKSDVFVFDRQTQSTVRVSVDSYGNEADGGSSNPRISADGRYVAFVSSAENLTSNDDNDRSDVFVHDLLTSETVLVSVNLDGVSGDDGSGSAAISSDGSCVAFVSNARDLIQNDESPYVDIYVRNMTNGTTRIVSVDDLGRQGSDGENTNPTISADGRYVAFVSESERLAPIDNNEHADILIHDAYGCRAVQILTQPIDQDVHIGQAFTLYVDAAGTRPYQYQWRKDGVDIPDAVAEELYIESPDPNDSGFYDVVVSNECGAVISDEAVVEVAGCTPVNEAISVSNGGAEVHADSKWPALSADGRYTAFHSAADGLAPGDVYGNTDVFVYDRHAGDTVWISRSYDGGHGNATSSKPAISADGRFVVYQSAAGNLVPDDDNNCLDVFLYDRDPDENGTYDDCDSLTRRLSVNADGVEGDDQSATVVISADGGRVAFRSAAENLLPGSGGSIEHIYARDLSTDELIRVSVNDGGDPGDGDSRNPSISADGERIVFSSYAGNLTAGDNNPYPDIFLRDLVQGVTTLVSVDAAGLSATGANYEPSISADGRYVAFASDAVLVPADQNGVTDIYVKDLQTGQIERVSTATGGSEANAGSLQAKISSDGRFVAFYSDASNLIPDDNNGVRDAFIHDRNAGVTTLVSASGWDVQGDGDSGAGAGGGLDISANGDWIAFNSAAGNLVDDDDNGVIDVFLRDWEATQNIRVSVSARGCPGTGLSRYVALSGDGVIAAYASDAPNLVAGDTNEEVDVFLRNRLTQETRRLNVSPSGEEMPHGHVAGFPVVSTDGRYVAYCCSFDALVPDDDNGRRDIFVYNVETGINTLISLSSSGEQANNDSGSTWYPISISATGRFVAFESSATNLVPNDSNDDRDIFLRDRDPDENGMFDEGNGETTRVSLDCYGMQPNSWSDKPTISADGRYIAFHNQGPLAPDDGNGKIDVYVRDRLNGTTERASLADDGAEPDKGCDNASISADGRYVAFASQATNLHPLDTNIYCDIFVRDRYAGETHIASLNSASEAADNYCGRPAISGDGRFVAFHSYAGNLVPGDHNGCSDVFVRDLLEETTIRVSNRLNGEELVYDSAHSAISYDGGLIAFHTRGEFVEGVFNGDTNIYVHQRSDCLEPQILSQPRDLTVQEGLQVVFEVVANANPAPQYQWRKDGVDIWGATSRKLTLDDAERSDAGQYDVVISNPLGDIVSEAATLSVSSPCPGDLDGDYDVDLSDLAQLLANYGAASGAAYADGDIDADGDVDLSDLAALLSVYGQTCSRSLP